VAKSGKKKKKPGVDAEGNKVVAVHRKARFLYTFEETLEAGIVLLGSEVKAAREGGVNLTDSFVRLRGHEAWLVGCRIDPYSAAGPFFNHEPERERKLLLHRREIDRLATKVKEKGLTLICPKLYFHEGKLKAQVVLGRGKKTHDKRAAIKDRAVKKEMDRAMKQYR
jgi:SsrA-binding protein